MTSRSYVFTINNPDSHPDLDHPLVRYAIYSLEQGESGTDHFQGYMELSRPARITQIHEIPGMEGAYLASRRGTREEARNYASKKSDPTFLEGPFEIGEWRTGGQGARTDWVGVRDEIKSGRNLKDIFEDHPDVFLRYFKGIQLAQSFYEPKDKPVPEVYLVYGPPGTGKTRYAVEHSDDPFLWSGTKWFDGFRSDQDLIMDDFRGQYPFAQLLRLMDRYDYRAEVKGTSIPVRSKKIWFTTNVLPWEWYDKDNARITPAALLRRFTKVIYIIDPAVIEEHSMESFRALF